MFHRLLRLENLYDSIHFLIEIVGDIAKAAIHLFIQIAKGFTILWGIFAILLFMATAYAIGYDIKHYDYFEKIFLYGTAVIVAIGTITFISALLLKTIIIIEQAAIKRKLRKIKIRRELKEKKELLHLLLEVIRTNCEVEKGKLDSMGNSAYADAIAVLIHENMLEFVDLILPNRVIAKVRDEK